MKITKVTKSSDYIIIHVHCTMIIILLEIVLIQKLKTAVFAIYFNICSSLWTFQNILIIHVQCDYLHILNKKNNTLALKLL